MAVVSKWICGSCYAQDVLFSISIDSKATFVICAACGSTRCTPPIDETEVIEMDGAKGERKGKWKLATLDEIESAGYASQADGVVANFYEGLFMNYPGYSPQPFNPADA
jgi:hypothetical protein